MNRKILLIVLALAFIMLATPLVGTVIAGKGNNKLSYEARFTLGAFDSITIRRAPPEGEYRVRFMTLTYSYPVDYFVLKIGGIEVPAMYSEAELTIINRNGGSFRLIKATETYTFDGVDGSLVVTVRGRTDDMNTPDQMDAVSVEGHGTGYFEGVKISAKGYSPLGDTSLKIHEGTIMGWPGLP